MANLLIAAVAIAIVALVIRDAKRIGSRKDVDGAGGDPGGFDGDGGDGGGDGGGD